MPELPEVETVVRDLNKKVIGRWIKAAWFDWPKMIKAADLHADRERGSTRRSIAEEFKRGIVGKRIVSVKRRGKNILIYLDQRKSAAEPKDQHESAILLIHQKMTGHLLVGRWQVKCQKSNVKCVVIPVSPPAVVDDPYNRFIHLIFTLDNGEMLALSDLRKFAKVILGTRTQIENLAELLKLGPDALKISFLNFQILIKQERRPIKQVLMDQEVISGLGNIYSDDILWTAKIHPLQRPHQLTTSQFPKLFRAMRQVLSRAVKLRGTSTSDFRDTAGKKGGYTDKRLVYQREDEPCQRCSTPIKRIKVGGRSAHFCPSCQKQ